MSIRFGNLGLEGLAAIDGSPHQTDHVVLVVDAPRGKGVFLDEEPLKPIDQSRTLKVYAIPIGNGDHPPTSKQEACGGSEWFYTIKFRNKVNGRWKTIYAHLVIHVCSSGQVVEVVDDEGDVLMGWDIPRKSPRKKPQAVKIPESLLN